MAKAKKKRAETYEKPLSIDGTFGDVIRVAVGKEPKKTEQQETKKPAKKKK